MITLTQLQYIVAVDTYRHFAKAAEKCFVSQPTLSMQIKKLEEDLGVVLFDRSRQPVIPTDIGQKIIDQARNVIKENNRISEIIVEHENEVSGSLTIGIIPTLASTLIPRFFGKFTRKYPQVQLEIRELKTEDILSELHRDILDVGILVSPLFEEKLTVVPLFYEEIKIYLNKEHPLQFKSSLNASELSSSDLWLLSSGNCFQSQVINLCSTKKQNGSLQNFTYQSGSFETLIKMVDKEGGYTLLPEMTVSDLSDIRSKNVKSFNEFMPLREVSLALARNFTKSKLVKLLEDTIKDSVSPVMLYGDRGQVVEWK